MSEARRGLTAHILRAALSVDVSPLQSGSNPKKKTHRIEVTMRPSSTILTRFRPSAAGSERITRGRFRSNNSLIACLKIGLRRDESFMGSPNNRPTIRTVFVSISGSGSSKAKHLTADAM